LGAKHVNIVALIRLIRPYQWVKNLLIFAPLFFSGNWSNLLAFQSIVAVLSFSLLASAAYCINDIKDVKKDRSHPKKQLRPIAAGEVGVTLAAILAVALTAGAFLIGEKLGPGFRVILLTYFALQFAYTFFVKKIVILDILLLSTLYVVRVLAGVAATGIQPSSWILICTWFIALMLASGKRYLEVSLHGSNSPISRQVLGKYSIQFLRQLISGTGMATLVCYLLWCQESVISTRFAPVEIYPSAMIVAFGIFRYQLLVIQKQFDEDPTKGLLKDAQIVICAIVYAAYFCTIIYAR
jgi:4-hydroxybenzoate polyprenyltransferase